MSVSTTRQHRMLMVALAWVLTACGGSTSSQLGMTGVTLAPTAVSAACMLDEWGPYRDDAWLGTDDGSVVSLATHVRAISETEHEVYLWAGALPIESAPSWLAHRWLVRRVSRTEWRAESIESLGPGSAAGVFVLNTDPNVPCYAISSERQP